MPINPETVAKIAKLAGLKIPAEEQVELHTLILMQYSGFVRPRIREMRQHKTFLEKLIEMVKEEPKITLKP